MEPSTESPGSIEEALAGVPKISFEQLPELILAKLQSWLELIAAMLPNLVLALLVFALFALMARVASSTMRRTIGRVSKNDSVNDLLSIVVRFTLLAIGLFLALGVLNLDRVVTSLLAGVGVVGLALGFAFQDIAANFMSGVIMAFSRPFDVGDLIETSSFFGTVEGIDLRTVRLRTQTGERVLIPNRQVYNEPLTNYTETPDRRVDIEVGVAYGDDLEKARAAAIEALESLEMRNPARPPEVFFEGFGDSSINFVARFWIHFRAQREFMAARSEAVIALKKALDRHGLTIPFPIRTLDFGARAVGGKTVGEVLQLPTSNAS